MARHKDTDWDLPEGTPKPGGSSVHEWQSIHSALLMDIRDELKRLNSTLHCASFLEIPHRLERIVRNTEKKTRPAGR